mmetsp:Transcript_28488/g.76878  ORF Transcript_28488/g.76878 Transcript_28488/m.76878 type:complete len:217 (-) Transcript_28488:828-1478(-)
MHHASHPFLSHALWTNLSPFFSHALFCQRGIGVQCAPPPPHTILPCLAPQRLLHLRNINDECRGWLLHCAALRRNSGWGLLCCILCLCAPCLGLGQISLAWHAHALLSSYKLCMLIFWRPRTALHLLLGSRKLRLTLFRLPTGILLPLHAGGLMLLLWLPAVLLSLLSSCKLPQPILRLWRTELIDVLGSCSQRVVVLRLPAGLLRFLSTRSLVLL